MNKRAVVVVVLAGAALAAGCAGEDEGSAVSASRAGDDVALASSGAESAPAAAASQEGITVVGSGSASVAPDAAEWSFGVRTAGDSASAALSANTAAMERVLDALREAGLESDDLRTQQVSVYPRTSGDGRSIDGYDASNTVSATIRDLDRAGAVVDAAVAAGANEVYGPSLTVSDSDAQYAAAVEAALDDARARAEAIAAKAGLALGPPVAIVEGGGGRPVPFAAAEAAAADVSVEPGVQEVTATLTVTYSLG